jgi:hypothetical protein
MGFLLEFGMCIGIEILFAGIFYLEHQNGLNKAANLLTVIRAGVKIGHGYHSYYAYLSTIKLSTSAQHGDVFSIYCHVFSNYTWGLVW